MALVAAFILGPFLLVLVAKLAATLVWRVVVGRFEFAHLVVPPVVALLALGAALWLVLSLRLAGGLAVLLLCLWWLPPLVVHTVRLMSLLGGSGHRLNSRRA